MSVKFQTCRKESPISFVQKGVHMFSPGLVRKWVSSALPKVTVRSLNWCWCSWAALNSQHQCRQLWAQLLESLGEVIMILLKNVHWSPLPHWSAAFHRCIFVTLSSEFHYREGNHIDPNLFLSWFHWGESGRRVTAPTWLNSQCWFKEIISQSS